MFPKIGDFPKSGCFIMENSIKMDDLGVHLFLETSTWMITSPQNLLVHTPGKSNQ